MRRTSLQLVRICPYPTLVQVFTIHLRYQHPDIRCSVLRLQDCLQDKDLGREGYRLGHCEHIDIPFMTFFLTYPYFSRVFRQWKKQKNQKSDQQRSGAKLATSCSKKSQNCICFLFAVREACVDQNVSTYPARAVIGGIF